MRWMLLILLLLVPTIPAAAQTPLRARVTQIDTTAYPDVTLYVSVIDTHNQPVSGLNERDFRLSEDGQAVAINRFSDGSTSRINTVLVIDRSLSMDDAGKLKGTKEAARRFVEQMRAGDQTLLIAFNSQIETKQSFTNDQALLDAAIGRLQPEGGTALYDSLIAGVDALKRSTGRRALVLLTDGQDCREANECPNEYGSMHSLQQAIDYANANGQPVSVIGLGNRASSEKDGIDETVLRQIAEKTDGTYFYAPTADQLANLYRQLSSGMQQEYALTYHSPRPFYDGTRRDIRVRVGDAPEAAGGYIERHMIDVRSDPLIGILLLLPILGALLLPAWLRRRPIQALAAAATPGQQRHVADGATIVQSPMRCHTCGATLMRPNARFCSECGVTQTSTADQRIFCDQCGRPMPLNAQRCPTCGADAPVSIRDHARAEQR